MYRTAATPMPPLMLDPSEYFLTDAMLALSWAMVSSLLWRMVILTKESPAGCK